MKLICARDRLTEAISVAQKAVATRSPMPILDGILVEAADGVVKLTGYNMEMGIESRFEADIPESGSIVLNSRIFGEIVRKLPGDVLSIESKNGQNVQIECDNVHFTIRGLNAEDYPKIPTVEQERQLAIPQRTLKEMILQTIFAVSTDESRPLLNGCFFRSEGKTLELVAIDGFRLALRRSVFEEELPAMSFIVPGKALMEVGRIIGGDKEEVRIYPSNNQILFVSEQVKIVSRLIQGDYMNYRSILPQTSETTIRVSPAALLGSIERASLVITSEDRRYPVRLSMPDDRTLIIGANTEMGTLREEVVVEMSGNRIDIDFNPRYFMDVLKVVADEEISIIFNGSMGPCVIKPREGDEFAYLVLPLRR